jgi:hypothetical protein
MKKKGELTIGKQKKIKEKIFNKKEPIIFDL